MKKHRNKFIGGVVILAVLVIAWFWGGAPEVNHPTPEPQAELLALAIHTPPPAIPIVEEVAVEPYIEAYEYEEIYDELVCDDPEPEEPYEPISEPEPEEELEPSPFDTVPEIANQDRFATTPEGVITPDIPLQERQILAAEHPEMRAPVEPEDMVVGDGSFYVTLSVRAHTILYNMHLLHRDKHELIPEDGWILPPTQVLAWEGESVFNVLQREMRRNRIHMVARWTPIFNSAYVEAINNLYEFDVGPLSGWMYRVNGWFPNFGASRYLLSDGDVIEWLFTVDLGRDLGVYWME